MTDLHFPQLSAEKPSATGVLATWYVADGDTVAADQLVAEVQMDKVDAEVVAPAAGTVRLLVEEGEEVAQGARIAEIT